MAEQFPINSPNWWESYFKDEWVAHGDREQTRAFTVAAIDGLEPEERHWFLQNAKTLCDWGCAMGDGVDVLAQAFPGVKVCGLDGSQAALSAARARYPQYRFGSGWDELLPDETSIDALLCSNCLEHFDKPQDLAMEQLRHVGALYVVLVPYRECPLSETHKIAFDENTLPESFAGFRRLYWKIVPVDTKIWPAGQQLLLVYGSESYIGQRAHARQTLQEKQKWDAIYSDMPLVDANGDDTTIAFNSELLEVFKPLLNKGDKVLEAGCGGGAQSLTLAERGGYDVSLLDFSTNALDYAVRLFAQHGRSVKTIEADAFAFGQAEYDLVFNAGVLEHYAFDEQVRFVKGMASRSTRFVMVLIPNRACYWYWIWRLQKAAQGQWPYGKEVPLVDMRAVFEAAGLDYVGQAFLGRKWSENFVEDLAGLSDDLREMILRLQRSSVVPSHTDGYLVAALGVVSGGQGYEPQSPWMSAQVTELRVQAEQTAMLADAIANEVGMAVGLNKLRRDADEQADQWRKTTSHQSTLIESQNESIVRLSKTAEVHHLALVEEQDRLRGVRVQIQQSEEQDRAQRVQLQQSEERLRGVRVQLQQSEDQDRAQREHIAALEKMMAAMKNSLSWRVSRPARFVMRLLRHGLLSEDRARLRQAARTVFRRVPLTASLRQSIVAKFAPRFLRAGSSPLGEVSISVAQGERVAIDFPLEPQAENLPDYVVWGVIDWHFRFQRPQHLAQGLARSGRRVFYVSSELRKGAKPGFDLEPLEPSGRQFQVHFKVSKPVPIYEGLPTANMLAELRLAVGELLCFVNSAHSIQLVQHPFWMDVATVIPNSRSGYDCMDHHAGFDNTALAIVQAEHQLITRCDEVVVTSQWLQDELNRIGRAAHIVRNGGDFAHFSEKPPSCYVDPQGRQVIGYYGAIASWMDLDLVRAVAVSFPEAVILMVGADTVEAQRQLVDINNMVWIGEVPYRGLPYYAHAFSVAIVPFKVLPLTLATNPVKIYEYLSAGLDVVSVALPETIPMGAVIRLASDTEAFVSAVGAALRTDAGPAVIRERQAYASQNTWDARVSDLTSIFESPSNQKLIDISVVVVTYNNIELTRACLSSLESSSPFDQLEIIVVDNASSDGTQSMLQTWQGEGPNRKLILNTENRGFSAANNQGLMECSGSYFCLLNNDTVVTSGWASSLRRVLQQDSTIGLVGPVTNNIGNEAKIDIKYTSITEMPNIARKYTMSHIGKTVDIPVAAFFCVMMRKDTFAKIGPLDEVFGLGFFEDDDYCMRLAKQGLRVVCCEDVFIHHHLSASFDKLPTKARRELMEKNKKLYEEKWGAWTPHKYR